MIKKLLTFTLSLLFSTSLAYADNLGSTKIGYLAGEKSQTGGIEDRDLSGSFEFRKYSIAVKATPLEDFYYKVGFTDYKKDFDSARDSLDNSSNAYKAYLSFPLYTSEEKGVHLNTDFLLCSKRYDNNSSSDSDETTLKGEFDIDFNENSSLGLLGGFKDYDYVNDTPSNELKSFFKLSPAVKLMEKVLAISGYYKRVWMDKPADKKDYSEDSLSIRTSLKIDNALIYKAAAHAEYGRNDTTDSDEDREDSLRFEYRLWDINTYHKPAENIDTKFTYGEKRRDYFTSRSSYNNWFIKNSTTIEIFKKDSLNVALTLKGEHKETHFYENGDLSYDKNAITGGLSLVKRADWSFKPSFNFTKYEYPPLSTKNEEDYKANLKFKKYIGSTDKAFEAGYWYKWKDYKYKSDSEQWSLNLSFELKF